MSPRGMPCLAPHLYLACVGIPSEPWTSPGSRAVAVESSSHVTGHGHWPRRWNSPAVRDSCWPRQVGRHDGPGCGGQRERGWITVIGTLGGVVVTALLGVVTVLLTQRSQYRRTEQEHRFQMERNYGLPSGTAMSATSCQRRTSSTEQPTCMSRIGQSRWTSASSFCTLHRNWQRCWRGTRPAV